MSLILEFGAENIGFFCIKKLEELQKKFNVSIANIEEKIEDNLISSW